ncbi:MAG: hypothetical protein IPO44_00090 [Candidatus Microthrix sp.]|nr:hypothetical protein [Candidatus Microthrix sp.]MBK9558031.1 hypothetical protein [Candidatus Microthrix sp.]
MSPPWNLNDPPSGDDIAAALQAFPVVADVLRATAEPPDRALPFHHVCGFDELFPCLSPLGLRLLQLDRFHGGVSRDAALLETSEVPPELVDREASNLVVAGLAVIRGDRLWSHPDIAWYIPMPPDARERSELDQQRPPRHGLPPDGHTVGHHQGRAE